MIQISSHRLQNNDVPYDFQKTPNGGSPLIPKYLVIHYTAGTSLSGAISWLQNPEAKASAHLVIDYDGKVVQMMDFNRVCWHAGQSTWGGIDSLNKHSIGIELVNAGILHKNASDEWVNWSGSKIPNNQVILARHKNQSDVNGWQIFDDKQVAAVVEIGIALRNKYSLLDVLGHDDIAPKRKIDPGPAFPMINVQSKIMGRE